MAILWLILFFILLPVAFLVARLVPAFRFLQNYRSTLSAVETETESSRQTIRIQDLTIHVYSPRDEPNASLILVPGLHPHGIYDPRCVSFAGCIARAGFQVLALDVEEFREFRISEQSVTSIEKLILALPQHFPAESFRNLGILGISYGAGPVFVAAAKEPAKAKVRFLVSIGGYYSLQHAIDFNLSGIHNGSGKPREAHPWGRIIFALHYLDQLVSPPDARILKESLQLRLKLQEREAEQKESFLSEYGKTFVAETLKGPGAERLDHMRRILETHSKAAASLSPENFVKNLNSDTRIYLLHGRPDQSIPYEETLEIEKALRQNGHRQVRSHVTDSLTHVDMAHASGILDLVKLLWLVRRLLAEA